MNFNIVDTTLDDINIFDVNKNINREKIIKYLMTVDIFDFIFLGNVKYRENIIEDINECIFIIKKYCKKNIKIIINIDDLIDNDEEYIDSIYADIFCIAKKDNIYKIIQKNLKSKELILLEDNNIIDEQLATCLLDNNIKLWIKNNKKIKKNVSLIVEKITYLNIFSYLDMLDIFNDEVVYKLLLINQLVKNKLYNRNKYIEFLSKKISCSIEHLAYFLEKEVDFNDILNIESDLAKLSVVDINILEKLVLKYKNKKFKLAIIIPTCNRSEVIRYYLEYILEDIKRYNISVIICDSSNNDFTKNVVKQYNQYNIIYYKYIEKNKQKTLDKKIYDLAKIFCDEYDYIWFCRDRSIPKLNVLYDIFLKYYKEDFYIIYPHTIDNNFYMIKNVIDNNKLFKNYCGDMTSLGTIIFSKRVLKKIVEGYPIDERKNYGLWIPMVLFYYIVDYNFRCKVILGNNFNYIPIYDTSFWIKSDTLLWLWCDRWVEMIESLPDIYMENKEAVLNFEGWKIPPYSKILLLANRMGGGLKYNDIKKYDNVIRKYWRISIKKIYILSLIPSKILKIILTHYKIKLLLKKIIQVIIMGKQTIFSILKKNKRIPYSGKNYGSIINNFEKIKNVKSNLIYGKVVEGTPLISIVIPTFKRVELLKEALNSVLRQKKVDFKWEVIIVDNNNCNDDTEEIYKYLLELDSEKVFLYKNEKILLAGDNFNRCIELSRGKWVAFLHDDDLLISDYLEKIGERIRRNYNKKKKLGYISGTHYLFRGKDRNAKEEVINMNYGIIAQKDNKKLIRILPYELLLTGSVGVVAPTTGTIMLKEAVVEFGGYNERINISADLILAYNMTKKYLVYRNDQPLGFYRWQDNVSKTKLLKIIEDLYDFREYVYNKNIIYKIIGHIFRQEHFISEVFGVMNMANIKYSEKEIKKYFTIMEYSPNNLRTIVFKFTKNIYRFIQKKIIFNKG